MLRIGWFEFHIINVITCKISILNLYNYKMLKAELRVRNL